MEHDASIQLLTLKKKKKSFTAQISASSLIPEEKLFPLESQAAIVFSKCEMFHGWQRLEEASSSNSDDVITWERAQRHQRNQDSSCRKGNEKRTEISSECVLLSPPGSFWHKVYRSEGSTNFQTAWTSKQKSAWAGSLKGSWPRVLQGSMAFEVSVWMVSGFDSAGETLV